jgi:integrase/recombinase XerD
MADPHFENNEVHISNYKRMLLLCDLKDSTIDTRIYSLVPFFNYLNNKNAKDVTRTDIEGYILSMRKSKKKKITQKKDIINTRAFFKWLKPENDFFDNIKIKREKPDNSKKEYVNAGDVKAMLPHCINQRDRVLLLLMWESGARLGELLSINVRDVKPQKYGVTVTVTGKTGKRDILIIDAVPDIQNWLNIYNPPSKDEPLFPVIGRSGKGRIKERGAQNVITQLAKKAGLKKRIYCHSFRHGRLTELSKLGLSEMMLRHYAGWTADSDMPATYLHTTQEDIFNRLLKIKGIVTEEESQETVNALSARKCPRCQTENAFDAKYCKNCSMILDHVTAMNLEKDKVDIDLAVMQAISMNPNVLNELKKRIEALQNNKMSD